jgi:hypothetical protein
MTTDHDGLVKGRPRSKPGTFVEPDPPAELAVVNDNILRLYRSWLGEGYPARVHSPVAQ